MKQQDYIYASSYIRVLESKMLTTADYDTMLRGNYASAVSFLASRKYGEGAGDIAYNEMEKSLNEALSACPESVPRGLFLLENDFHNFKSILKAMAAGVDYNLFTLTPSVYDPTALYNAISAKKFSDLPAEFIPCAEQAIALFAEGQGQHGEVIIDRAYFAEIVRIAKGTKNDFVIAWVQLNIDLTNMKTAVRAARRTASADEIQNAMISGGNVDVPRLVTAASGDTDKVYTVFNTIGYNDATQAAELDELDRWCDTRLLKYLEQVEYSAFGFEVVLAFITRKRYEVRNVSMILAGLNSGMDAQAIREKLV